MIIRAITSADITIISRWFQYRRWPLPPVENVMPRDGFVACHDDGTLLACAWLYSTGSSKAEVSWMNMNPDVEEDVAKAALLAVVEWIQKAVSYSDPPIRLLVSFTDDEQVIRSLESLGFRIRYGYARLTWTAPEKSKDEPITAA